MYCESFQTRLSRGLHIKRHMTNMQQVYSRRLTRLTLILRTLGLIGMELTFIVGYLALLSMNEQQALKYVRMGVYLIKDSTRVVKVGIDGSCQIFVMRLCPHQTDADSR